MLTRLERLIEYGSVNYGGIMVLALVGALFPYFSGQNDYIKSYSTLVFATLVTWFCHYILHHHNKYNPIAKIHAITHHSPFAETFLGKLIEYAIIEFFFFGGGILLALTLWIKYKCGVYIMDPYILLYWSIAVPLVHELHYHQLAVTDYHKLHHEHPEAHYSPECWDIIMGTRAENSPMENEALASPVLFGLALVMLLFVGTKWDFIKHISEVPTPSA